MEPAVKRRLRGLVLPVLFLVVTAYFVFNAINGSRGIIAQRHDKAVLVKDRQSLTDVTARRDRWQARVDALHHHAIAPDMLNEQARAVLNLADPDDLAVPLHPTPAPVAPAVSTPAAPSRPHS
jgi:cell division protein FtsB